MCGPQGMLRTFQTELRRGGRARAAHPPRVLRLALTRVPQGVRRLSVVAPARRDVPASRQGLLLPGRRLRVRARAWRGLARARRRRRLALRASTRSRCAAASSPGGCARCARSRISSLRRARSGAPTSDRVYLSGARNVRSDRLHRAGALRAPGLRRRRRPRASFAARAARAACRSTSSSCTRATS